jgi:outer membrane protein
MPQQKVNQLRLQSLDRFQKAARSAMYPTIAAFGNLNSAYSSALDVLPKGTPVLTNLPIGLVTVDATTYTVVRPSLISTEFNKATFFRQLDFQFRQNVGLTLNVPIFNGGSAKTNWQRSKLNYQSQQLQVERDNLTLKQDITRAYNDATAAYQRYQASVKTVATAEYSFELTRKRYEAGLLRTIDLITNQNNLFRARLEQTANQFEYVFRMKVLEFYKGQGLKL